MQIAVLQNHSDTIKQVNDSLLAEIQRNLENDDVIRQKLDR